MQFMQKNFGRNFTFLQKSWSYTARNREIDSHQFEISLFQIWLFNFYSNFDTLKIFLKMLIWNFKLIRMTHNR